MFGRSPLSHPCPLHCLEAAPASTPSRKGGAAQHCLWFGGRHSRGPNRPKPPHPTCPTPRPMPRTSKDRTPSCLGWRAGVAPTCNASHMPPLRLRGAPLTAFATAGLVGPFAPSVTAASASQAGGDGFTGHSTALDGCDSDQAWLRLQQHRDTSYGQGHAWHWRAPAACAATKVAALRSMDPTTNTREHHSAGSSSLRAQSAARHLSRRDRPPALERAAETRPPTK